jgi:hypothetical protein
MKLHDIIRLAVLAAMALVASACVAVLARGGGGPFGRPLDGREIWLLCALAFGAMAGFLAALRGGAWSGLLCAMLFAGGAAQLWLTDPDWFPSLRVRPTSALHVAMLGLVGAQGAFSVAALAWFSRASARDAIRKLGHLRIALWLGLSCAFCVAIMDYLNPPELKQYAVNLAVGGAAVGAFLLNAIALACAPDLPRLHRIASTRLAPMIASGFAFLAAAVLAHFAFGGASLVQDEAAYMFQARIFAEGALFAPPPPGEVRDAFQHFLIAMDDNRWYAVPAPGYSMALALALLAGAPLLLNPLLGGASVLLTHRAASRFLDPQSANLVAILAAASPWLLFSSASLMTHALSLALSLCAAVLALEDKDEGGKRKAALMPLLVAGMLMGWLFVTRALEGVLLGGALGLYVLWGHWRTAPLAVVAYGVGCFATGVLGFGFNAALTGDLLQSPQGQYIEQLWGPRANAFGFGADIGPPQGWGSLDLAQGHSPLEGLTTTQNGLTSMSFDLFGWTAGSLALVFAWAIWGRRRGAPLIMAALAALVLGAHFFYWFNASFYIGPRYWYGAFVPVVILSVAGVDALAHRLGEGARERITSAVLILACFGATVFVSWRAVEKYAVRSEDGRRIGAIARSEGYRDALVITRDAELAENAMIFNDPFQRIGAPIFAFAKDDAAEMALIKAYPDRRVIRLDRAQ